MTSRPGARSRRRAAVLVGVYATAVLSAYLLWVCFSYLFVPMAAAADYPVPFWQRGGYYTFRPGVYENPRHGVVYTINRHGFRGPDFDRQKRGYRIICIGESSTMGLESADPETWPARLQQDLGDGVEVINAGISGSTSREHRAMLRELLRYEPDLVVYYAGRNDHGIAGVERYPGPRSWPLGRLNFLRAWFLYKRVQLRLLLQPIVDLDDWVTWSNGWARPYRENLSAMYRDATETGARFVVVSQVLEQMTLPLSFRTPGWYSHLRQIDALAIQRDVIPPERFIDIRTEFLSSSTGLFADEVHLTPHGNAVLAHVIGRALRRRGLFPE